MYLVPVLIGLIGLVLLYLYLFGSSSTYTDGYNYAKRELKDSNDIDMTINYLADKADNPFDKTDFDRGIKDAIHDYLKYSTD